MIERSIPAYNPSTPTSLPPDKYITQSEKKLAIKQGRGRSVDHGRAFRFFFPVTIDNRTYKTKNREVASTCDEGCKMGPHVMLANAAEEEWAQALTAGWAPLETKSQC